MDRGEIDLLVEQIRNIILNKPLNESMKSEAEELADLPEAVSYLSNCLSESNEFLKHLRMGELDVTPPSRHNFLAGNLKELHSALRHLTWQANQVANGDYSQSVHFLGDFSTSFNQMIQQLAERESQLKLQSTLLSETVEMMKSVMDGLNEWIVVTSKETGELIYANKAAKQAYCMEQSSAECRQGYRQLLRFLQQHKEENTENRTFEYSCDIQKRVFRIRSYTVQWSGKLAYAHFISDVTSEQKYHDQMEELAYLDALTGLHNRRYCLERLEQLIERRAEFTFCMIDLDGLKYANDNFGHSAGDQYLKTVAEEMRRVIRSTDLVCRIGGDEFAAIFPNCKSEVISEKMKHLDAVLAERSEQFPMSFSFGVVYVAQDSTLSPQAVMEEADQNMYLLKNWKKIAKNEQGEHGMAFTWSKDLETGNAQIDKEHQELIQATNQLLDACAAGKGRSELGKTMDFLDQVHQDPFRPRGGVTGPVPLSRLHQPQALPRRLPQDRGGPLSASKDRGTHLAAGGGDQPAAGGLAGQPHQE